MAILSREFKPEPDSELFDPETGKCSIEYYNACKDPYRVAAHNKIPVPWPLKESGASICGEVFGQLEEQIRGVLGSFGITTHDICVRKLATRNPPWEARDTIIIKTHDEPHGSWKEAVSKIYHEIVEPAAAAAQRR